MAGETFSNDAEYLSSECQFLRVRGSRLAAEKSAETERDICESDPEVASRFRVAERNSKCRVIELKGIEENLRRSIDERLGVLRADPKHPKLGLNKLTDEHRLSAEERLILLAAMVPAISNRQGELVLAGIGCSYYAAISVQDAIAMLDPRNVGHWLAHRKWFRPSGALVKNGLLIVKPNDKVISPNTLSTAEVHLSMTAFAVVTGDPEAAHEFPETVS